MVKKSYDYTILFVTMLLVCFGIVMVFSSSYYYAQVTFHDSYYFFKKQIIGAVLGLIGMIIFMKIDYWKLEKYANALLVISIVLLGVVLIPGVGRSTNGATRWICIGGKNIGQPSEVAKFAVILFLASSMTKRKKKMTSFFKGVLPYLLITGIVFLLIFKQPNLSIAGSIVILTIIMLYAGGAKLWHILSLIVVGGLGAYGIIAFDKEGFRYKRLLAFLNPWADQKVKGYQLIQSLYSLGSGGLFGMGLGNSRQKFLYLPYRESDFIFSIIGEELGFVGAVVLILIFLVLIWRGLRVAITVQDSFGSYLATGIVSIIAIQVIINIAVATGSMPTTGVPLPFISAGSSSLVMFMCSIGILLNISKYSKAG